MYYINIPTSALWRVTKYLRNNWVTFEDKEVDEYLTQIKFPHIEDEFEFRKLVIKLKHEGVRTFEVDNQLTENKMKLRSILNEDNLPWGAEHRPDAPWNQPEDGSDYEAYTEVPGDHEFTPAFNKGDMTYFTRGNEYFMINSSKAWSDDKQGFMDYDSSNVYESIIDLVNDVYHGEDTAEIIELDADPEDAYLMYVDPKADTNFGQDVRDHMNRGAIREVIKKEIKKLKK